MKGNDFSQVEQDICAAGTAAMNIASEAAVEYAIYWTARHDGTGKGSINYGRMQGLRTALSWMLGYQTEDVYKDMTDVLFDYIEERGEALARKNLEVYAAESEKAAQVDEEPPSASRPLNPGGPAE